MIGRTISHYRIIEALGSGGMGHVYLAEDVRLGRKLALKVLAPKLVTDHERVRRFGQEARAASALNHPNILTIHDIGQDGDVHFIATEFVDGETLRVRLDRGRLEPVQVLEIAIQTGSALAAAHDAGIVHRDVKPENVMLRPDGYVKVLDFGLAKLTASGFTSAVTDRQTHTVMETNPGVVLGTFTYMSPEQARGEAIDARSDIFSLGIMLYEMLSGRLPFDEEIRRARAAAARALELDETLVEAHALAAYLKFRFDWDWTGAEIEFKRALELNPGHAPSRHAYAMFLGSRGRFDEAMQEMRRAQQLDPLSLIVASGIGRILHFEGRFDEAIAQYRQVMQMDPTFLRVWFDLGLTLVAKGAYDEAFEGLKKAGSQPFALMLTTIGQVLAGHRDRATAAIGRLEEHARAGTIGSDEMALLYATLGESRRGSQLLERACEERAAALSYVAVEPMMRFLLADSECRPVLERAGLIAPVRSEGGPGPGA